MKTLLNRNPNESRLINHWYYCFTASLSPFWLFFHIGQKDHFFSIRDGCVWIIQKYLSEIDDILIFSLCFRLHASVAWKRDEKEIHCVLINWQCVVISLVKPRHPFRSSPLRMLIHARVCSDPTASQLILRPWSVFIDVFLGLLSFDSCDCLSISF